MNMASMYLIVEGIVHRRPLWTTTGMLPRSTLWIRLLFSVANTFTNIVATLEAFKLSVPEALPIVNKLIVKVLTASTDYSSPLILGRTMVTVRFDISVASMNLWLETFIGGRELSTMLWTTLLFNVASYVATSTVNRLQPP